MDAALAALKQKWLSTGSFADEQAYLEAWVRRGHEEVPCVMVDPTGKMLPWLLVVVRRATGVVYQTQCGGVPCLQRWIEGFLVPLEFWNSELCRYVDVNAFMDVFHGSYNEGEREYSEEELKKRRPSGHSYAA